MRSRPSRCSSPTEASTPSHNAFATLLDPGDEVLLPAPYWTTYPEAIRLAGGVPVEVPTGAASGFKVTAEQLEAAATERTKLLVFVSPSNPTGAVYDKDQIAEIGQLAADRGWWVFTDEIYEHLVYEGHAQHSMPVVVPELADRCVIANGVAKTYAMTGWRVGWLIGPADVVEAATNLQSHVTSNVNNVAQRAAICALEGDLSAVAEMKAAFDRRRRTIFKLLSDIDGVLCLEPEGAFYAFPSFEAVLGRELRGKRPTDHPRARRAGARGVPRRLRARRGLRCTGLRPLLLRFVGRGPRPGDRTSRRAPVGAGRIGAGA